jgi:hypothetical protein
LPRTGSLPVTNHFNRVAYFESIEKASCNVTWGNKQRVFEERPTVSGTTVLAVDKYL